MRLPGNNLKKLMGLKDMLSLKKEVARLEGSLKEKDELIKRLEEENSSLEARLSNMVLEYKDVDSKIAGLNYKLYWLNRENRILIMNLTGARAQRDGMFRWIKKIKGEPHDSLDK